MRNEGGGFAANIYICGDARRFAMVGFSRIVSLPLEGNAVKLK